MNLEREGGEEDKNYHFKDGLAYTDDKVLVHNIFVYNIPKKATQYAIMAYFSQFGDINKVRLVAIPKRKNRKVGFVHFNYPSEAAKVLKQTSPHTLKSKRIYVRACDGWHQPHKPRTTNLDASSTGCDEVALTSGKTSSLTMLNDDCIEHIVKLLELKDQVRFSLTCQRFRNVFEMVCKNDHKNHCIEKLCSLTLWEIREFFITAGPYIESLRFRSLYEPVLYKDHDRVIEFISTFCPNIKSIYFDCIELKSTVLMKLFENLGQCSMVGLRKCSLNDHAILALKKLPNLESLSVADNYELTGKHMEHLTTLKNLSLYGCGNIQSTHFVEIFKSLKNLQKLNIQLCEGLTPVAIQEMVVNCQKLETLMLSCTVSPYEHIALLPCLKKLELLNRSTVLPIREHLFEDLVKLKANQLEYLKICAKNCINLERANLIGRLTSLKYLNCSNNENLTDDCLRKFRRLKNLEKIVLKNCRAITDVGLVYLLRKCTKLKKVNIQQCSHITDQFVINAIEVLTKTQNQRGKEPCVFQVARSGINSYMINHSAYLAATSLMKLSFHMPLTLGFGNDDRYDYSDYSLNDDDDYYDDHYLSDDMEDYNFDDYDPYDRFGASSDSDDFDFDDDMSGTFSASDDEEMHNAIRIYDYLYDLDEHYDDLLW